MRRLTWLLLLFVCAVPEMRAQISGPDIFYFAGVPSGNCGTQTFAVDAGNGVVYYCVSGTWTTISTTGSGSVSAVSGDGTLITNVSSSGSVTLTVGTAPAHKFWNGAWTQPAISDLTATFSSPLNLTTNTLSCATCGVTGSPLSQFASTTSAQLAGVLSDETGTALAVFNNGPTLIAPVLGTPASGVATNLTGTASGLTAGNVTTNANLTGPITSSGNATSIGSQTGTGSTFAMSASPTFTGTVSAAAMTLSGTLTTDLTGGGTQCVHVSNTGVASGTGSDCGSGGGGSGTVTSVATTSPITGGTFTTAGTIGCATCTTSASSLTSTALVTGGGSQALQTPATTATMDSSGNISTPGSVSVAGDGTHAGIVEVVGNTTAPTIGTNYFGWIGPNSASFTKYVLQPSATAPAATGPMVVGAVSSSVSAVSYGTTTGSGTVYVLATSPSLVTPTLGVASATTVNKVTLTAPATGSTLTIVDGKTLTANNSIALSGTDSTVMTLPGTSATIARTDAGQTFTGTQVLTATIGSTSTATTQSQGDNSTKLSTTAYTDLAVANAVAGVNPAVAVIAASTASLTGTYSNGAAGIGATFTVTATGAFTLDGVSIGTIGQRVLLKNQSSAFQNGVYTATIVGTTGVSPVFTRALDYDTPSEMNSTGAVPVQSGTANTTTSWLLTSTVTTIGTDALTYVQFSLAPSSLVTASSPGIGLCHFAGSTQACTSSAVNLASADVTGVLPVANGGTNNASLTFPSGTATVPQTVASGQTAMPTGALSGNACSASATTATATGSATTDAVEVTYASDPTGVTGYGGGTGGGITVRAWPTSNTMNFKLCNESSGSITPGALNINWRVVR